MHKQLKYHAQGHTVIKWQAQNWRPSNFILDLVLSTIQLSFLHICKGLRQGLGIRLSTQKKNTNHELTI